MTTRQGSARGKSASWRNDKHAEQWQNTLDTYAAPVIGELAVGDGFSVHSAVHQLLYATEQWPPEIL